MAIRLGVWKFLLRKHALLIAVLMFCAVSATKNMRSPKGILCCSYADGHRTGYDIRQGQYWVPIEGEWYPVPRP
jgi:hypothetical protein